MTQGKLDGDSLLRDAVALTHRFDSRGALDELIGRRLVVVVRPGARVGQDAAVEDTAGDDRDPSLDAERQQLLQPHLVEHRVAAREEETVEVRFAGETGEHLGLVHAGPDRFDRPFRPETVERRVCACQSLGEVLVGVVDVEDVDPVDAETRDALLDRAHHAVVREVVDGVEGRSAGKSVALRRRACAKEPANFRREHELVPRLGAQNRAQALFGQAVPVLRRGVEKTDAGRPRGLDDSVRIVIRQGLEEAPQGRGAKAEPRHVEGRSPEPDPRCRVQAEAPAATCFRSQRSPLAMWAVAAARASSGSPCMIAS